MRSRFYQGVVLLAGILVVLAAPIAFLWHTLRPEPWDAAHLLVRFESVRYERAGLVFAYRVENRTRRSGQFQPKATTLRVLQPPDRPVAGFPVIRLPFELASRATQRVELRLELPLPRAHEEDLRRSNEQTERVLQHKLPSLQDLDSQLAPLPMIQPPAPPPAPPTIVDIETLCRDSLNTVQGFELIERDRGIRIVFPRGW